MDGGIPLHLLKGQLVLQGDGSLNVIEPDYELAVHFKSDQDLFDFFELEGSFEFES